MKNSTGTFAAMRMRGLAATLPLAAFALAFAPTVFADIVAGDGEMAAISVATGTQTESGPVMLSQQSDGIQKTGEGEYILPLSSFAMRDGVLIAVREGKTTIADTGAEGVSVAAPECLQNAALWLDAGQNTVVENGVVTKWLDVREGATDNNAYYCAGGGVSPDVVTEGGKTFVDFGAFSASGKWLSLQNTSRESMRSFATRYLRLATFVS